MANPESEVVVEPREDSSAVLIRQKFSPELRQTIAALSVAERRKLLKLCSRRLYDAQHQRIQQQLRFGQFERDCKFPPKQMELLLEFAQGYEIRAEKAYEGVIALLIKNEPIITDWIDDVIGIGPRIGGLLISNIGDIGRFPNVAKLWAYCGLHVVSCDVLTLNDTTQIHGCIVGDTDTHYGIRVQAQVKEMDKDGEEIDVDKMVIRMVEKSKVIDAKIGDKFAARRAKGEMANWHAELKKTAFKIGGSFLKARGKYYTKIYNPYYERKLQEWLNTGHIVWGKNMKTDRWEVVHLPPNIETKDIPDQPPEKTPWTIGHLHNMATRYTAKMFLSHLWAKWRELEGLEVTMPYAITHLGHTTYISPDDMRGYDIVPVRNSKKKAEEVSV